MTNNVYKSAQGKMVDMGALVLQNEKVRAVGNMNVNAKGDLVDSNNQIISSKNAQVNKQYEQTIIGDANKKTYAQINAEQAAKRQAIQPTHVAPAPIVPDEDPLAALAGKPKAPPAPEIPKEILAQAMADDFSDLIPDETSDPAAEEPAESAPKSGAAAALAKAKSKKA